MTSTYVTWPAALAAALALNLAGCGGAVTFADQQPISVTGTPPATPEPAPEPKRVEVKQDRIQINDKILFDFDKATIRPESHDLLAEIIQVIKDHPHIKKISIEGHTSSEGTDAYNQGLSQRRAQSVRQYLVKGGIAAAKLTFKGLGESRPIADNETEEGKEKNRRVEFLITEQEEVTKVYLEDPETGERTEVTEGASSASGGGQQ